MHARSHICMCFAMRGKQELQSNHVEFLSGDPTRLTANVNSHRSDGGIKQHTIKDGDDG